MKNFFWLEHVRAHRKRKKPTRSAEPVQKGYSGGAHAAPPPPTGLAQLIPALGGEPAEGLRLWPIPWAQPRYLRAREVETRYSAFRTSSSSSSPSERARLGGCHDVARRVARRAALSATSRAMYPHVSVSRSPSRRPSGSIRRIGVSWRRTHRVHESQYERPLIWWYRLRDGNKPVEPLVVPLVLSQ